MEFRNVTAGYDLETGFYFVIDSELRVVAEARSLSALRRKLEPLELIPELSKVYAALAPEFSRATRPRTERQSSRRLDMAAIPKRQRRSR
jgi:hypothetical protein